QRAHVLARWCRAAALASAGHPRPDERAADQLDPLDGREAGDRRLPDRGRHCVVRRARLMKNVKYLSQNALIGIIVGGILVVGLAVWFPLVHPQSRTVASLKQQAQEVQQKIDACHQQVATARSAPKIEVADVYRLAKAMPSKTDMPDVVLELSQLARDTGISFDSISPQAIAAVGSYSVLPISVTFNGNFYNLADFLY